LDAIIPQEAMAFMICASVVETNAAASRSLHIIMAVLLLLMMRGWCW
jgi:hypothetical protein